MLRNTNSQTLAWIVLAGLDLLMDADHLKAAMFSITILTLVEFRTFEMGGQTKSWLGSFESSRLQRILFTILMLLADIYTLSTSGIHFLTLSRILITITCVISYSKFVYDNNGIAKNVIRDSVPADVTIDNEAPKDSVFSTLSKYYPLRQYFVASTTQGRIQLMALFVIALIGSWANFYMDIYASRIVDTLQLFSNSTGSGDENFLNLPKIQIEFRTDLIIIYYSLKLFCQEGIWTLKHYFKSHLQRDSQTRMKKDIFTKLQSLSLRWHLENETEQVFDLMSSAPCILSDILDTLNYLIPEFLDLIIAVIYLLKTYPHKLTGIIILTAVVSSIINCYVLRRRDHVLKEVRETQAKLKSTRNITFKHFETVSYFTNEEYEKKQYIDAFHREKALNARQYIFEHGFSILGTVIRSGAEMCVLMLVVQSITGGDGLTAGDYLYFQGVFSTIFWPLESAISSFKTFQENALSAKKFVDVMSLTPEVSDAADAEPLPSASPNVKGDSLEFRNVCFSYVPEREIVKNLNFCISPGSTVAFVGRSGSGKSTLTKLIFRFYDVSSGQILVNGKDIRSLQCRSLRQAIAVVPQDVVLFSDTIKNNIHYGNIGSTEDDIRAASVSACLHDRIDSLPDKYETEVGKSGLKLSGGEKQRVAIARAMLKNPRILILDEATSSLDTSTERQIQESLEKLYENRTTIIIAHRLSTIVNVDKIFVMENGMIVESGRHIDLVSKRDGVYAAMWNLQFSDENETKSPALFCKLHKSINLCVTSTSISEYYTCIT